MSSIPNLNIGILGHVDSGKTSLAKLISSVPSTACFDKNTQSKERGITIDLGFSSLSIKTPDHLKDDTQSDIIQYTFIDCPGHASLIKTIIGGAQIMDMMMLVIDASKGIQAQTAECIVIGEITCNKAIIILNKVDLYPSDKRSMMIDKMTKKLTKIFALTSFRNSHIIPFSTLELQDCKDFSIKSLIDSLSKISFIPKRNKLGPFIMNVDHCFNIKGHGTILTGTVLNGTIAINEDIEIPDLKLLRKIKSIQMYKQPIISTSQGDRIGMSISQFDASSFERGLICSPSTLTTAHLVLCTVNCVRYFKGQCLSNSKFHITIGHSTSMAKVIFCSSNTQHISQTEALSRLSIQNSSVAKIGETYSMNDMEYQFLDSLEFNPESKSQQDTFVLLSFEDAAQICRPGFLYIASRLDMYSTASSSDRSTSKRNNPSASGDKTCRLAFYGNILATYDSDLFGTAARQPKMTLPKPSKQNVECSNFANRSPLPKVYKVKAKRGLVERLHDETTVIVKSMFKRDSKISAFVGFLVEFYPEHLCPDPTQKGLGGKQAARDIDEGGVDREPLFKGRIEGSFGQSGKIKVALTDQIPDFYKSGIKVLKKNMADKTLGNNVASDTADIKDGLKDSIVGVMRFKKYIFDPLKKPYPISRRTNCEKK